MASPAKSVSLKSPATFASRSLANSVLAHADASRNAALMKAQQEQEARKRRIEALETSDEVDEELENPLDQLE